MYAEFTPPPKKNPSKDKKVKWSAQYVGEFVLLYISVVIALHHSLLILFLFISVVFDLHHDSHCFFIYWTVCWIFNMA